MTTFSYDFTMNGRKAQCVMEMVHQVASDAVAAGLLRDAWEADPLGEQSNQVRFDGVTVYGAQPFTAVSAEQGRIPLPPVPINTSYLINKNPLAGRRGRMYLIGPAEIEVDSVGAIVATRIPILEGKMNAMLGKLDVDDVQLAIKDSVGNPNVIQSFTVQPICGTQRRRMRK